MPAKATMAWPGPRRLTSVCEAEVVSVRQTRAFDHTTLLTMRVPADMAMREVLPRRLRECRHERDKCYCSHRGAAE